jgi:hypothetical protein
MIIEQTVIIPADHRLHLDLEVPSEIPAGRARASLTLICEEGRQKPTAGNWVNPLLGLAKAKGAKLTLERFMEMQQEEIERENDQRLWIDK